MGQNNFLETKDPKAQIWLWIKWHSSAYLRPFSAMAYIWGSVVEINNENMLSIHGR